MLVHMVDNMTASNIDLREVLIETGCATIFSGAPPANEPAAATCEAQQVNFGLPTPWNDLTTLLFPGAPPAGSAAELLQTAQDERWQRNVLHRQQDAKMVGFCDTLDEIGWEDFDEVGTCNLPNLVSGNDDNALEFERPRGDLFQ